jgi:hypothetical protein
VEFEYKQEHIINQLGTLRRHKNDYSEELLTIIKHPTGTLIIFKAGPIGAVDRPTNFKIKSEINIKILYLNLFILILYKL